MQNTKPHAALLASPGMGHLIPVLELGRSLVTHHALEITIFVVTNDATISQSPQIKQSEIPNSLNIVVLPPVDISGGGPVDVATPIGKIIFDMMRESLPALRCAISAMKRRPVALIVDLFGTEALAIGDEFRMLKYVFIATNAWFLASVMYATTSDQKVIDEHVNQQQPLQLPGCKPIRFEDTLKLFLNWNDQNFDEFMRLGIAMSKADGILVNTWEDLESTTLGALRDTNMLRPFVKAPVYSIGPVGRPNERLVLRNDQVRDWLDMQPNESVIYVSFGSGGTLSAEQIIELAGGLELSKQRFIWVVRPPMKNKACEFYLTVGNGPDGTLDYLPGGFLTRVAKMGLVVPNWASQVEILAHPSVGGFVTHCGWNSVLESILNGVPMIAWPLFAEQKMNATLLTEEFKVAVRSKTLPSDGVVKREEVEMMIRRIMVGKEGHAMRENVRKLKHCAEKASGVGGSSYNSLSLLAKDCQTSLRYPKSLSD